MLKNFLRIAQRYLLRYKTYTTIKGLGLAVGVTCCILIMLFVRSEFSYDRWNAKAGRIYRVWQIAHIQGQDFPSTTLPVPTGPAIAETFPTVEASCRIYAFGTQVRIGNTSFNENI